MSLTLVGDRAMARLNRETFGRRGPTNVIAFPVDIGEVGGGEGQGAHPPAPCPAPRPPTPHIAGSTGILPVSGDRRGEAGLIPPSGAPPTVLGEVVISLETTRRQAQESGWPLEELFDFYLIHGILHLLGYDHDTPETEAAMEAKAWELMDGIDKYLA